jgi:hypothetical protein
MSKPWKDSVVLLKQEFKPNNKFVRELFYSLDKKDLEELKDMQEERHDLLLCLKLVGESSWRDKRLNNLQKSIEVLECKIEYNKARFVK